MRNALIWLSSASVLLLAVSCADVPNAPEITGEATAAVVEPAKQVQAVDDGLLILSMRPPSQSLKKAT